MGHKYGNYDEAGTIRSIVTIYRALLIHQMARYELEVRRESAIIERHVSEVERQWWKKATRRPKVANLPDVAEWIIGKKILPVDNNQVVGTRLAVGHATELVFRTNALKFHVAQHDGWLVVSKAARHRPLAAPKA